MKTVNFVLLVISVFLLGAIILAIVLDTNERSMDVVDVDIDIIFMDKGRGRWETQFRVWKQQWRTRRSLRFIVFSPNRIEFSTGDDTVFIAIQTSESENTLYTTAGTLIPSTEGRHFLWASDNVIPLHRVSASTFQVPHSDLWRFFGGCHSDEIVMNLQAEYEETLPVGVFPYTLTQGRNIIEFRHALLNPETKACFTYIYQTVLLRQETDISQLSKHFPSQLFQIVHISPQSNSTIALNQAVIAFWQSLVT